MELETGLQTQTQTSEAPTEPDTDVEVGTESLHLAARLAKLAMDAKRNDNVIKSRTFSKNDTAILHRCLDTIEKTLSLPDNNDNDNGDPRPILTKEITKHRPQNLSLSLTPHYPSPPSSTAALPSPSAASHTLTAESEAAQSLLTALLEEVTALGCELDRRRSEAFQIYELFTRKCQGLERRVAGLEGEVQELHSDILENSIEREGLRGTVYGLESWVDGWQRDHELAVTQARESRKGWTKRKPALRKEEDADALFDGITAWMRGWKDVEEGFQAREREREQRRDMRQKLRVDAIDDEENFQYHLDFPFSNAGEGTADMNKQ